MRFLSALITASILSLVWHTASAEDDFLIPCNTAPQEAILNLPEPLASWGQIYCTVFGHTVSAKGQWIWSFPGAFAPVHLPAQMAKRNPEKVQHAAYFKSVELLTLDSAAAEDASNKLNKKLSTAPEKVAAAYKLTLTNQEGHSHVVLFVQSAADVASGKGFWGFWCEPGCEEGLPFMLLNYEGKK